MHLLVLSKSESFNLNLSKNLAADNKIIFVGNINKVTKKSLLDAEVIVLHRTSYSKDIDALITKVCQISTSPIVTAADTPNLEEMLLLCGVGSAAYFNSYMAQPHYYQMLEFVVSGKKWYHPSLLESALQIASDVVASKTKVNTVLNNLTNRERQVVECVSGGMTNKVIAKTCGIKERTVKAHLTKIFKKTGVSDRTSLVVLMNNSAQK